MTTNDANDAELAADLFALLCEQPRLSPGDFASRLAKIAGDHGQRLAEVTRALAAREAEPLVGYAVLDDAGLVSEACWCGDDGDCDALTEARSVAMRDRQRLVALHAREFER